MSRRTNRTDVPSRSAASSTVNSLSNNSVLLLLCSAHGHGAKFLFGDPSLFPRSSGCRGGQPRLPGALVAPPEVGPGGNNDHGLVVLGPSPGVQWKGVAAAPAHGIGDPGPPQRPQGGGVAAALGREVAAEAQHVCPPPQPQPGQAWAGGQLQAGPD